MDSTKNFEGKVIVFEGDFCQVLSVVSHGTRAETVNASFAKSYLWSKMKLLKLTKNMRSVITVFRSAWRTIKIKKSRH